MTKIRYKYRYTLKEDGKTYSGTTYAYEEFEEYKNTLIKKHRDMTSLYLELVEEIVEDDSSDACEVMCWADGIPITFDDWDNWTSNS